MAIVKRNADLVEQGFTPTESEIMAERIVSASSGLDDALAKADAMLQGHYPAAPSAVPDVVPEPADFSKSVPPKEDGYAYHATSKYRMRDIEESGAIETFPPDHGTDQDMWPDGSVTPRSYWSESPKSAQSFYPDDGPPVLIRSKRGSLRIEKGTGDLYTETPVSLGRDVVEFWGKDGRWHRLGGTALVPPKSSVVTSFDKLAVLVTRVKAFIRQQWENQQQIGFIHPSIRRMMKNVPGPILPEPDWAALKAMEPSPNTTSQIVMQQIRGELSDDVATALESKIRTIRVRATKDTINPKGKWREGTPEEVAVWAKMNGEDIPASGSYTGRVHEDVSRQTSSGRTIGYRNSSDVIEIKEFTQLDVLDRIVRDNLEATNAELANLFSKEIVALTGRRAPARVKLNPVFEKMKNSISNVNAAGRSALLNNPLNVIRGIGSDAASDSIRAAMEGHLPAAVESLNLWSYIRKLTGQETPVQRIMQWTGQDAPQDLKVLYGRTDMDVAGRTATNKMISNTVGLKEGGTADKVVGALTGVIDNKTGAQLRAGADNVRREAVFEESLESMAGPSGRRFREQAMAWGEKHGIEGSSVYAYLDDLGRWYSPAEVNARMLELARDAGLADDVAVKFADRLSRNWQSEMSQMIKKADAEQKRLYFTYERTNLDETLSKVIFYHYWMTRAVPAYIKIGLRNPYIAASWIRSWEDVKKRAEEQGLPKSLGGYLKVMGSRDGWYGSINIWNVFLPIMDMRPDLMAQGKWDQVTQFFAVAPILSAFVSTIGLDNSVVDVFSTYTMRNMGMAIINKVRAETGRSPITGDGYEQLMRSGYEHINDFLQWADIPFAQEQAYRDPSINKRLMIRYVVGSIVAERTGVPTDQWVEGGPEYAMWADAVNDGEAGVENELYQEAQLQWADETLSGAVKNTVIPGGYRTSFGPQVELSAGGPNAGDLTQGQKDTKKLFGSGSPEDVKLDALQAQYMDIGSSQQKAFAEGYKSIVADDPIKGYDNGYVIQIGSEHYTKTQLLDLTKDERFTLAKAWVNQHGGTEILQDYRDKRDAFTAKHPEFGEVTDYQQIAYTYDGGLHQFRMDRAAGNPNFKKAMLDHREYLLKEVGVDPALIEVELDNWAPTIAAYKAANGIQDSLYDSPPISTGDQGTVNTLVNMGMLDKNKGGGGGGSYGGKKSTADTLNKSLKSYETDMKLVQDLLQQYGVDPAVLTSSNPYAIQTVNSLVGDLMPKETALMKDYFDWIALQPPGADTSPEAFAAIIDAIAQDKAA